MGAEMRSVLHDLRRREWAWSATAPGGRKRECDKGENKEQTARATANELPATIFSSGPFKSHLRTHKRTNFCLPTKVRFFELSVPLARNVKYASQVKCAFGTICGTLNFTLRQGRNTSLGRKSKLHCGLPQLHF